MTAATKTQIGYILDLATQLTGRTAHSLYDIRGLLTGSHRNFTKADASATIEDLKAQLAAKTEQAAEPAPEPTTTTTTSDDGMDPATAISLLGKEVHLVSTRETEVTGAVMTIRLNADSEPSLELSTKLGYRRWALARIASWQVVDR